MAMAAAFGFENDAFWAQVAVLYNEKAMASVDRSAEDGSAPKAYRGPTTADELRAWFDKASANAAAIQGGGVPLQIPPQHGVAGRGPEHGPPVNAMGLVSAEGMQAWLDSMSAEPAANRHGVPSQVRPQQPRLLGRSWPSPHVQLPLPRFTASPGRIPAEEITTLADVERAISDPKTTLPTLRNILRYTFNLRAPNRARKPALLTMTKVALAERQKR
ncbi:unnamed protein product [Laminaria digitata]